MGKETNTVTILDREYRVNCKAEDMANLREAAFELDQRLRAIRQQGKVIGLEKMAIMAALNMSNELLLAHQQLEAERQEMRHEVQRLSDKVAITLQQKVREETEAPPVDLTHQEQVLNSTSQPIYVEPAENL